MMTRFEHATYMAIALLTISLSAMADNHMPEEIVRAPDGGDTYATGGRIEMRDAIQGDLVAAGTSVRVTGEVSEDVVAAAATIEILAPVGDDARLAGADIELAAPVAGHAVIAGADILVDENATIADWLWVSGSRVRVKGDIGGELRVSGRFVELDGRIGGDVDLTGGTLRVGDDAVIEGNLTWRSGEAIEISDSAIVQGDITEESPPQFLDDIEEEAAEAGAMAGLVALLSLLVSAGVLRMLLPAAVSGWSDGAARRPLASFVAGLAVFATTPLVVILFFAAVVTWPLALMALILYLLILLVAGFAGLNALASILLLWLRRGAADAPGAALTWGALALAALVTVLVPPLYFLLAALGLGAMAICFYQRWSAQ